MGFTKLDSGIVNSSIWSEPSSTRVLWITMLAMSDESGFVSISVPGLIRAANITNDEFKSGITALESPDEFSRTKEYDGKRVEKIDGGWIILNYPKYREREDKDVHREYMRNWRKNRSCEITVNHGKSQNFTVESPSASASASASALNSLALKEDLLYIVTPKNESIETIKDNNRVLTVKEPLLDGEKKVEKDYGLEGSDSELIPDSLRGVWGDFVEMRKTIKSPMTTNAKKLIINKLEKMAPGDDARKKEIIEQSIMNNWKGVFDIKNSNFGQRKSVLTSEEMMKSLNS